MGPWTQLLSSLGPLFPLKWGAGGEGETLEQEIRVRLFLADAHTPSWDGFASWLGRETFPLTDHDSHLVLPGYPCPTGRGVVRAVQPILLS